MPLIEGMCEDAPEALGEMLIKAIKERDAKLMNNLLRRHFLWGKFHQQLTKEEQRWITEHTEHPPVSHNDFDNYD